MTTLTACTLDCPDACSLLVSSDSSGKLRIKGNPEHPITQGFTCPRLRNAVRRLHHPQRITDPLLRTRQGWKKTTWEEALDLCARRIQQLRAEPQRILHIQGHANKGVLAFYPEAFFGRLGSSTLGGSLCDDAGILACITDFGSLDANAVDDMVDAAAIVNWGKDLGRSSTHLAALVKKARKKGCPVLTISPGGDANGSYSDATIRVRPGTDRFLAASVLNFLLQGGKLHMDLLDKAVHGKEFLDLIRSFSVESLVNRCGAHIDDVKRLASFYADFHPVTTIVGWGLQRYPRGGENVRFINALAFFTGHIGVRGGGVLYNISSMRNFNLSWLKQTTSARRRLLVPRIGREILAANPPVSLVWINGTNVANQAPESHTVAQALEQVPFVIVVDAFMTDTAQRADVILPCTLNLERNDIVGSFMHDYVHVVRSVSIPPGKARDDWWIIDAVNRRMDPPLSLPGPERAIRLSLQSSMLQLTPEELERRHFVRARRDRVAFRNGVYHHGDTKMRLPTTIHEEPPVPGRFPLRLLSLVRRKATHSQILPEDHPEILSARIHPETPSLIPLSFEDGDLADMVSPQGRLRIRLRWDTSLVPGVVVCRRGGWMSLGCGVNAVVEAHLTDMGEAAAYYGQYVRLEPIQEDPSL